MSRKRSHEDVSEDIFVYYENTDLSSIPTKVTSLRIHSSVKTIPPYAFRGRGNLVNVEYPEGLQVIGESAFCSCQSLREQQFPSTLVEIGPEAFNDCYELEVVGSFPLNLKLIGQCAFFQCTNLRSIEILSGACNLQKSVFSACYRLTHVRLPQGLVIIPKCLFHGCKSLVDVQLPSSLIEIGGAAFKLCRLLATIELPIGLKIIGSGAFTITGFKTFHFPSTVETIGEGVLSDCKELESVTLPPKLVTIPNEIFKGCRKLKDVCLPKSVAHVGNSAFENSALTNLDFSQCNLTSIGDCAFESCRLTDLDLSQCNLTSIGRRAFAGCRRLKKILLPRTSLKTIEVGTFQECILLTHLWIPPTVECIKTGAFGKCSSLLSVELPESLNRVGFVGQYLSISGYNSLVNFWLPTSHELENARRHYFMENLKLGEASNGYEDLVSKLKQRFDCLPLHRACYFQSYHTLQDNIDSIQGIVKADPDACSKVDFAGMTPFHVLGLSQMPCPHMFQLLLSVVPSVDVVIRSRDVFGYSPLDYLCNKHSTTALNVAKSLLRSIFKPRVACIGLDRWREELQTDLEMIEASDTASIVPNVASFRRNLAVHERMEVQSLLEIAVWRMKVKEQSMGLHQAGDGAAIALWNQPSADQCDAFHAHKRTIEI
ncbi:unnamed protein product [Cylindrotheca closterium]|uniref:Uncharacterized protein n=1 Tax=Cylindrotheca closterium TaxID=2856 RepID=A0AAD2CDB3_9STRA|nr:unnamed protein product [Cylindrotheca closterium]